MSFVMLLEDDPFHLEFLNSTVQETSLAEHEVRSFDNGLDAISALQDGDVASAVLDLQVPSKTGIDVARAIWSKDPLTPIVFWSNYGDASYVRAIVKIVPEGANFGYILKTTSGDRLKRSLLGVLEDGQRIIDSEIRGMLKNKGADHAELTETEFETLNYLALGLTDKAIAKLQGISLRSVQNQIQSVHDKIAVKTQDTFDDASLINRRCRTISNALVAGLINGSSLEDFQKIVSEKIATLQ